MTSPAKPPSGPRDVALSRERGPASDRSPGEPGSHVRAASTPSLDPVLAVIAEELRAGRLSAVDVVDAVVARALESDVASGLGPDGRRSLEAHLRASLADDPALARLVGDVGRAR